jgi:homoserine kinase type II
MNRNGIDKRGSYRHFHDEEDVRVAVGEYGVGPVLEAVPLTGGIDNSNYLVDTDKGKYVLRFFKMPGKDPAEIAFEMEAMKWCREKGVRVPRIYEKKHAEPLGGGKQLQTILMDYVDGQTMYQREVPTDLARKIGREIGKLDTALSSYGDEAVGRQDDNYDLQHFLRLEAWVDKLPDDFDRNLVRKSFQQFRRINDAFSRMPAGLIHNDVVPDNLLEKGGEVAAIIDFSDLLRAPYIQEVAVSITRFAFSYDWNPTTARALLDGYQEERRISDREIGVLYELVLARQTMLVIGFWKDYCENGGRNVDLSYVRETYDFMRRFSEIGKKEFLSLFRKT